MPKFKYDVWDAVYKGDIDALATALESYPHLIDASCSLMYGKTPMYIAAARGHVEIVIKLIELGSNAIDTPSTYGYTPLYAAASSGCVLTIETLMYLGSKAIDTPDKDGRTPMFIAAYYGHVSAIEALVRLGSKAINTPDNYGCTPMRMVVFLNRNASAIETFLRLGCNTIDTPNKRGLTLICDVARSGDAKSVIILKMLGANCFNPSFNILSVKMTKLLNTQVDENNSATLRYNVYFRRSLASRLLFTTKDYV